MKFKGLKGVLMLFFVSMCFLGFFFRMNNKKTPEPDAPQKISAVETVLQRNLNSNYPSTPKEVVKYFSEITKCYYNEEFEDEADIEALARQMLLLYDDELVSYKNFSDYMFDLKSDIRFYNENGYKIGGYSTSASTDVFYFQEDGFEWARLYCIFTIKSGKEKKDVTEVFVLRKDDKSHWKIYGWKEENG